MQTNSANRVVARSDIHTPDHFCKYIYELLADFNFKTVLDPCSGSNNLTQYFPKKTKIIEYEIKKGTNFFDATYDQIKDAEVCLMNPPFAGGGSKLLPELFIRHALSLNPDLKIVAIVPHGLRFNNSKRSKRLKWLSTLKISSTISQSLDLFEGISFHTETLFINFPDGSLKPHYTYVEPVEGNTSKANPLMETLSKPQIGKVIKKAEEEIQKRKAQEKARALTNIKSMMDYFNLSEADLLK